METILLVVLGLFFSLGYLLEKLTNFVKQLKSSGTANLINGFKAELSIVPIHKKDEACGPNTNSIHNDFD